MAKNNKQCIVAKMNKGMSSNQAKKECAPRQSGLVSNGEMSQAEVDKYIKPQLK